MDTARYEAAVVSPAVDDDPTAAVNRWVIGPMAALNRDILAGREPPDAFPAMVRHTVGPLLDAPERYGPRDSRQLLVLLGIVGAGLGRHFQERHPTHRATPERAFDVGVGAEPIGFLDYFRRLAEHSGTGHPHRDTYASLTRWNLPPSEAWWGGTRLAVLPGVFDDGALRTYTAAVDEVRFFELIKLSETFERAVNLAVGPLTEGGVDLLGAEALHRLGVAALLLEGMRKLNADFAALPPAEGLSAGHFMDVFRQFAVHWRPGDVPPSGALDPEALERDLVLGTEAPGFREHLHRMGPGLLPDERDRLAAVADAPGLTELVLQRCDPEDGLAQATQTQLRMLVGRFPVLAALHLVLQANARMSGVHLMLSKRYLFNPQRARDRSGFGDPGVVSNRRGTTGMDETALEHLTRVRQRHPLVALRALPTAELEALTGLAALRADAPGDLAATVGFDGAPALRRRPTADEQAGPVRPPGGTA
ncbi:hypothetical protein Drose_18565 [Dactylosporangium roseum]|uniref:Uncharacterized protein n=1 Tax=Dactylosporangium roseum TaxID=47989 RepID=A0ABY5ZEB7_9ACTN|nr:hypothetical protein [Dactylosporangium roseum]UWZ40024.1 hypothetical protein Drose_18565 [Dactylosporangium roseum]